MPFPCQSGNPKVRKNSGVIYGGEGEWRKISEVMSGVAQGLSLGSPIIISVTGMMVLAMNGSFDSFIA